LQQISHDLSGFKKLSGLIEFENIPNKENEPNRM
jgi:hypothetical protein